MVLNQKPTGLAGSLPGSLCLGGCASALGTVLFAALLAKLVDASVLAEENIGYGVMVLLFVSAFAGATVACKKAKRRFALICALSGVVYMGILLSVTALLFGGQYSAVGVTALVVFGGSMLPIFLRVERKNSARRSGRGHKNRYSAQKSKLGK